MTEGRRNRMHSQKASKLKTFFFSSETNKTKKKRPALAMPRPSSEGPPRRGPSTTTPWPSLTFRGYLPAAPPETAAGATPQLLPPPLRR